MYITHACIGEGGNTDSVDVVIPDSYKNDDDELMSDESDDPPS